MKIDESEHENLKKRGNAENTRVRDKNEGTYFCGGEKGRHLYIPV